MSEMHPAQIDDIMVLPQMYAGNTLHIDHIVQFMVSMVLYFPMPSSIGAGSAKACVLCCIILYYNFNTFISHLTSLHHSIPIQPAKRVWRLKPPLP